jgi:hypothetical protein
VAQDNKICLDCHDSDLAFAKMAPDKKKRPPIDDIHRLAAQHPPALEGRALRRMPHAHRRQALPVPRDPEQGQGREEVRHLPQRQQLAQCAPLSPPGQAEEQNKYGFLNSVILSNSYVVGATRNPTLDMILIGLFIATWLGVIGHGIVRIITTRLRRSKNHD